MHINTNKLIYVVNKQIHICKVLLNRVCLYQGENPDLITIFRRAGRVGLRVQQRRAYWRTRSVSVPLSRKRLFILVRAVLKGRVSTPLYVYILDEVICLAPP